MAEKEMHHDRKSLPQKFHGNRVDRIAMGNIISNIHQRIVAIEEIPIPPMKTLSESQVSLIKKSWEIPAAKPLDAGEKILYMYLERFPLNQQKFAAFKNTPLMMLKGTPGFRSHANKIMNIFGIAIDCLGKQGGIEEIVRVLNEMGKNHRRRGIPKKAFVELRVIIIEVLAGLCHLDDEGKTAWNDLIDIVYHVVFTNLDEKRLL